MKNKNENKSFFDTLALVTLFAVLFSIGMHIGKNTEGEPIITATVTVTIKNAKFSEEMKELITKNRNSHPDPESQSTRFTDTTNGLETNENCNTCREYCDKIAFFTDTIYNVSQNENNSNQSNETPLKLQALEKLLIDGKYECELISIDETTLRFACQGKQKEAGFLTAGAKYLSENQPIELKGEGNYIYGRIERIARIGGYAQ